MVVVVVVVVEVVVVVVVVEAVVVVVVVVVEAVVHHRLPVLSTAQRCSTHPTQTIHSRLPHCAPAPGSHSACLKTVPSDATIVLSRHN